MKTDRIDARGLARPHRAGELTPVRVPSPAEEALRDLVRTREDLKDDRRVACQRVKSFLLRYGKHPPTGSGRWGVRYELWLQALRFEEPAAQAAFDHLMSAASVRAAQLAAIEREIEQAALCGSLAGPVARLRALRGIDTLTAVTVACETCDFARFPTAAGYMAFTGPRCAASWPCVRRYSRPSCSPTPGRRRRASMRPTASWRPGAAQTRRRWPSRGSSAASSGGDDRAHRRLKD